MPERESGAWPGNPGLRSCNKERKRRTSHQDHEEATDHGNLWKHRMKMTKEVHHWTVRYEWNDAFRFEIRGLQTSDPAKNDDQS